MGSVGHLFRFLFERVEFVVKGEGGGGGKGRITSKTRQIRDPVHLEKREFESFAVTMPLFISLFIQQSIHLFLF